ncbi:MAG: hypothetical protein JEZ03_17960 [Bacteroidales bacterium]|nr:hypothetical protein [Bacteroidales bacterium]
MTKRSIRDGIIFIAGFHFLLAIIGVIGSASFFVYGILPHLGSGQPGLAQQIFLPILGVIAGIGISGYYIYLGIGLINLRNSARIGAIFFGAIGIISGFVGVLISVSSKFLGPVTPDFISVAFFGLAIVCGYSILSFMNIFAIVFMFNQNVRDIFYHEDKNGEEINSLSELQENSD